MARRPNLASECLGLALRQLAGVWQKHHGYRPLLAESFHDPAVHQGTLYQATNWTPLGLTKGFKRRRADFYSALQSPKRRWIRPLQQHSQQLLGRPGTLPEEHRAGIAEATCGARRALDKILDDLREPRWKGSSGVLWTARWPSRSDVAEDLGGKSQPRQLAAG